MHSEILLSLENSNHKSNEQPASQRFPDSWIVGQYDIIILWFTFGYKKVMVCIFIRRPSNPLIRKTMFISDIKKSKHSIQIARTWSYDIPERPTFYFNHLILWFASYIPINRKTNGLVYLPTTFHTIAESNQQYNSGSTCVVAIDLESRPPASRTTL